MKEFLLPDSYPNQGLPKFGEGAGGFAPQLLAFSPNLVVPGLGKRWGALLAPMAFHCCPSHLAGQQGWVLHHLGTGNWAKGGYPQTQLLVPSFRYHPCHSARQWGRDYKAQQSGIRLGEVVPKASFWAANATPDTSLGSGSEDFKSPGARNQGQGCYPHPSSPPHRF